MAEYESTPSVNSLSGNASETPSERSICSVLVPETSTVWASSSDERPEATRALRKIRPHSHFSRTPEQVRSISRTRCVSCPDESSGVSSNGVSGRFESVVGRVSNVRWWVQRTRCGPTSVTRQLVTSASSGAPSTRTRRPSARVVAIVVSEAQPARVEAPVTASTEHQPIRLSVRAAVSGWTDVCCFGLGMTERGLIPLTTDRTAVGVEVPEVPFRIGGERSRMASHCPVSRHTPPQDPDR
jgi:hypothetical protein